VGGDPKTLKTIKTKSDLDRRVAVRRATRKQGERIKTGRGENKRLSGQSKGRVFRTWGKQGGTQIMSGGHTANAKGRGKFPGRERKKKKFRTQVPGGNLKKSNGTEG